MDRLGDGVCRISLSGKDPVGGSGHRGKSGVPIPTAGSWTPVDWVDSSLAEPEDWSSEDFEGPSATDFGGAWDDAVLEAASTLESLSSPTVAEIKAAFIAAIGALTTNPELSELVAVVAGHGVASAQYWEQNWTSWYEDFCYDDGGGGPANAAGFLLTEGGDDLCEPDPPHVSFEPTSSDQARPVGPEDVPLVILAGQDVMGCLGLSGLLAAFADGMDRLENAGKHAGDVADESGRELREQVRRDVVRADGRRGVILKLGVKFAKRLSIGLMLLDGFLASAGAFYGVN